MKHYWFTKRMQYAIGHDCNALGCKDLPNEDLIAMQTIDADCNDCKWFKRGAFHKAPGLDWFEGHCTQFDRPTKAFPGQYSGWPCFEHRREKQQ